MPNLNAEDLRELADALDALDKARATGFAPTNAYGALNLDCKDSWVAVNGGYADEPYTVEVTSQ